MKPILLIAPLALMIAAPWAPACGPFFRATLFSSWENDRILLAPPVADIAAEVQLAAGAPRQPEDDLRPGIRKKAVLPGGLTISREGLHPDAADVLERDLEDLGEALGNREGRTGLLVAYAQARRAVLSGLPVLLDDHADAGARSGSESPPAGASPNLPKGLPDEFRLYAEGAAEYQSGKREEARAAWEKVLALPEADRKFRGTWAAWMLGRLAVKQDPARAVEYFRQIRREVRAGGRDSLNRAGASFGWEALAEEECLTKEGADFSVKRAERLLWLLACHARQGGGEPYFLSGHHHATNQELALRRLSELAGEWMLEPGKAQACAGSPWLRRVMTTSLLPISREEPMPLEEQPARDPADPAVRWFAVLEKSDAAGREDIGDRLAWAAYQNGDYTLAAGWLKRAVDSPMADWLRAKLALQEGLMEEAAGYLGKAAPAFAVAGPQADRHEDYNGYPDEASALQREQFQADLGMVRLALDDFPGSLDALSRSGFAEDAAYVLENVVTAEEAVKYAVKWPLQKEFKGESGPLPEPLTVDSLAEWLAGEEPTVDYPAGTAAEDLTEADGRANGIRQLHLVTARRLAREDDTNTGRQFMTVRMRQVLDYFLAQRAAGQDASRPKPERAAAFWKAALIHRYLGMEIWGYEESPDFASSGGAYDGENVRNRRLGIRPRDADGEEIETHEDPPVVFPPATDGEKKRLAAHVPHPGKRFNYRYHAWGLAKQGFDLMPDNSEDLAWMLNLTGWWFAKFDEEAARRCHTELLRRCPATVVARQAKLSTWMVPMDPEIEKRLKQLK